MTGTTLASLAQELNSRHAARAERGPLLPPLLLMTDPARLPDPCAAAACLPEGAGIILRAYEAPERRRLAYALTDLARQRGLLLLISLDADLAAEVGAGGVHLPETMIHLGATLRRRADWLITCAAHSLPALHKAARVGADAALLSPVFPTASHPERPALGPHYFAALVRRAGLPVYALGGISETNAPLLLASRAVGLAGISGLSAGA